MKTKQILISISFLITLALSISSCSEEETPVIDNPQVEFNIQNPSSGAMFHSGDTVRVQGTITYPKSMHGYELSLINSSQNDTMVFSEHEHIDSKSIEINTFWVNDVKHHSNMELHIDAMTDHFGAFERKTITFHCHPKM
jgi:hypothetical protein